MVEIQKIIVELGEGRIIIIIVELNEAVENPFDPEDSCQLSNIETVVESR